MMANIYRVVAEHAAPRKGFSDVVQQTSPMISGQLRGSNADEQTLHNSFEVAQTSFVRLTYGHPRTCAAWSRVKHGSPEHYSYSCSSEHKHCLGLKVPTKFFATCTPGMQKEKDNAANAVLWDVCFFNHQYYQYIAALQDNQVKNIYLVQPLHQRVLRKFRKTSNGATYENFVGHSSDDSLDFLRCLRLISPCKAVTTNCPVVSPSSFNSSIALATSCGTRAAIVCDFALTDFVAISELLRVRCSTVWQKESECKRLTCSTPWPTLVLNTLSTGKAQEAHKITKPAGATNTNGPLTTSDNNVSR